MRFRWFLAVFSVAALVCLESVPVAAGMTYSPSKSVPVFGLTQQDLDGDSTPDVTVIECAFATERDRVLVYDQSGDMVAGSRWEEITDFRDDVWIFDAGADGTAQLIVVFDLEDARHTALVYDDVDGDGQVRYRSDGSQVKIEESDYWHVKVRSEQAWGLPGGRQAFLIDGYDGLGYGVSASMLFGVGSGRDGTIDWQIDLGDKDGDATLDYQLQWAVSSFLTNLKYAGVHKTKLLVQPANPPSVPYPGAVFWPLLIDKGDVGGRYFDHTPALAVDWQVGRIVAIGIQGFPVEAGYHVFSRLPLEKNIINAANWENPMAYYDMANDQDGWPELQVRFDVAVPFDPYFPYPYQGQIERPNLEVNYSWDQDNDNRWDYKMNLGGNYPIVEVVDFPDFAVKSVPYEEVIPWVRDRTWDVAMLVHDSRPSPDSEGMFAKGWMIFRGWAGGKPIMPSGVKDKYLMGFSDQPPVENYQDIQEGMRGEYSFQYFDTPRIYLSALDRQLHLSGARSGVWNLGEAHRLRYANLDGDAYLDQWQEEDDGVVLQQLNYSQEIYVLSEPDRVVVRQVDTEPALFETQPPGDNAEWERLDAQLTAHQATFPPEDFAGMLGQLPGRETQLQGAMMRDYRITPQGFRFILELQPGFSFPLDQQDLAPLLGAAGTYVIEYDGRAWSARPATPASVEVSDLRVTAQDGALTALEWTTAEAIFRNGGLEDAHDLTVAAIFDGPGGQQVVMTDTVALLPGEGEQRVAWNWAPPAAGAWQIQVTANDGALESAAPAAQAIVEAVVEVSDAARPSVPWLISLGGRVPGSIVLFLLAAVAAAGLAAAAWAKGAGV